LERVGERNDVIPLGEAAERLGLSRLALWRRCKDLGVLSYRDPVNRRQRLLRRAELENTVKALADRRRPPQAPPVAPLGAHAEPGQT